MFNPFLADDTDIRDVTIQGREIVISHSSGGFDVARTGRLMPSIKKAHWSSFDPAAPAVPSCSKIQNVLLSLTIGNYSNYYSARGNVSRADLITTTARCHR